MPEDNAELFRRAFAAWSEGTFEQHVAERWHPDMVLWDPPDLPDAGRHVGRDAAVQRFFEYAEPLGRFAVELEELVESSDAVMAGAQLAGQSEGAGVPIQARIYYVVRFLDERVIEMRLFQDRTAALSALAGTRTPVDR